MGAICHACMIVSRDESIGVTTFPPIIGGKADEQFIEFAISRARGEKGSREVAVGGNQVLHARYYFQDTVTVTNGT